ncbi:probable Dihydrolipoyllysine-residue acetyltransferase component of pyruvate dehydrogenase complex, mitochondrial [Hanseniaspora guilliermondii]|uniref:Acetyltransferase component of pyruvate dehydrogenase complex n=1 Tax=Hanseniaspora guilliermondii TaxID=56406 RepID=A0A1L0B3H9_9ASCO|nr:probable Dihydrolipoyllysine-residue acetyltransferase component of pyruvate dehydrogenase complex, mitochondrial [Hanseniaspora guilliermondii]
MLSRTVLKKASLFAKNNNATKLAVLRMYASYPPHNIIGMPALSPTMTQGGLAVWSKQIGDHLEPGCVLAEVETDKAQMDFEFQEEGYLAKVLVPEGSKDIPVNTPIAVYVEEEADVAAFKDFTVADAGSKKEAPKEEAPKKEAPKEEAPKKEAPVKKAASAPVSTSGRIFASPLAKVLALEHGIALKDVTPTGPNGRIVKADIDAFLASPKAKAAAAPAQAPAPSASASYTDIPVTTMRSIIGKRLLESTQTIPSFIISSNINVAKLLKLRAALNQTAPVKLSVNDVLVKAITAAAKKVPEANSYWLENEQVIRQFKNVDVSVAVATPTGLLTPIVKNAESKGLVEVSAEIKDLVSKAKENKLKPEEFQGGTICISNLGMNSAVTMFTSIINPPQSTILAIGTINKVPVQDVAAPNGFTFVEQMNITGTFDHRTIDGAKAAEFMKALKTVVENPLELLL